MKKNKKKKSVALVPLVGSIRFAREMPRRNVRTLCLCEPLGGGLANSPKDQAFLDMVCGLPGAMFDAERGHFVCNEHGGCYQCQHRWDAKCECRRRDRELIERRSPFGGEWRRNLKESQIALRALANIEAALQANFYAARPRATREAWDIHKGIVWARTFESLTQQVRISTRLHLVRSDN